jgi:hypothetical protein
MLTTRALGTAGPGCCASAVHRHAAALHNDGSRALIVE